MVRPLDPDKDTKAINKMLGLKIQSPITSLSNPHNPKSFTETETIQH